MDTFFDMKPGVCVDRRYAMFKPCAMKRKWHHDGYLKVSDKHVDIHRMKSIIISTLLTFPFVQAMSIGNVASLVRRQVDVPPAIEPIEKPLDDATDPAIPNATDENQGTAPQDTNQEPETPEQPAPPETPQQSQVPSPETPEQPAPPETPQQSQVPSPETPPETPTTVTPTAFPTQANLLNYKVTADSTFQSMYNRNPIELSALFQKACQDFPDGTGQCIREMRIADELAGERKRCERKPRKPTFFKTDKSRCFLEVEGKYNSPTEKQVLFSVLEETIRRVSRNESIPLGELVKGPNRHQNIICADNLHKQTMFTFPTGMIVNAFQNVPGGKEDATAHLRYKIRCEDVEQAKLRCPEVLPKALTFLNLIPVAGILISSTVSVVCAII